MVVVVMGKKQAADHRLYLFAVKAFPLYSLPFL